MNPEQTVRTALAAMEAHDLDKCFSYLSDDFMVSGGTLPQPLNRSEWLAQNASLLTAFPDWKFNIQNVSVQGNQVAVAARPSGTHSGPLTLFARGLPPIPPTGKQVSYPDNYIFTFKGDKISVMRFDSPADGGTAAMLQQLGVQVPPR